MALAIAQPFIDAIVRRARPHWVRAPVSAVLEAYERFGPVERIGLPGGQRLSVLAPHPDDESIGCGGLLALWARAGRQAEVIFLTEGERGSRALRDPALPEAERQAGMAALRATRRAEAAAALAGLGAEAVWFDGADGALARDEARLAARLAAHWRASPPDLVAVPFPADRHADHAAAARIAGAALPEAAEVLAYEVWSPLPANALLDISAVAEAKWQAIAAHRSQVASTDYVAAAQALGTYRARSGGQAEGHAEAYFRAGAAQFARLAESLRV